MFRVIEEEFCAQLIRRRNRQGRSLPAFVLVFAIILLAAVQPSPVSAASWDNLIKEQSKKLFEDTKKLLEKNTEPAKEEQQPSDDKSPAAAAPSGQQKQQQPQAQPTETARFDKPWVKEVQTHLTGLGYNPGPIDGAFGSKSKKAISAFQQERGDAVTGLPTPTVMQALRHDAAAAAPVAAQTKPQTTAQTTAPVAAPAETKVAAAASPSRASGTNASEDLKPLASSAGRYAAWADVCGDPATSADVRSDFLARAELLTPDEQPGIIKLFERRYAKKKKNGTQ